ncbi:hypothetical protein SDC9_114773 [bioreactor metagenome]|uniref:Uncharacterized protein n=1 Tax=bioreactor metagenome TaxID=1076179 RepID=A0A645BRY6_9ZZZZ
MQSLTNEQIESLAQPFLSIRDAVLDFYKDPAHEIAFQTWYLEKYGHPAPEGV